MTKKQRANLETAPTIKPSIGFTVAANDVILHPQLSNGAKMLYMYAMSRPEGWLWRRSHVCDVLKICRDTYRKLIAEVKQFGGDRKLLVVSVKRGRPPVYVYQWASNPFCDDDTSELRLPLRNRLFQSQPGDGEGREISPRTAEVQAENLSEAEKTCHIVSNKTLVSKKNPLPVSEENGPELFEKLEPRAVEITDKEKENSAKERERARRKERREMAKVHILDCYNEFVRSQGLDPRGMKPSAAHWTLAHARFAECAVQLRCEAPEIKMTDEEWVRHAAQMFTDAMWAYIDDKYVRAKTWGHFCSVDKFRALIAPEQKVGRL